MLWQGQARHCNSTGRRARGATTGHPHCPLADATSTAPFYHVGILVADIEDAVERFSTALDLAFAPILTTPGVRLHGVDEGEYEVHWTFPRQGPPYIELIEGQGDGFFSLVQGERRSEFEIWLASPG
jgi:Glyoxalase/Bleomycin resistance protein/Dioxygenase superfamily